MPTYEYECAEHGISHTLRFPVDARPDTIVLRRRTVPSCVSVGVGARPPSIGDKLAQGYKDLESRGQLRNPGPAAPSVKTIKRAIAMPDVD